MLKFSINNPILRTTTLSALVLLAGCLGKPPTAGDSANFIEEANAKEAPATASKTTSASTPPQAITIEKLTPRHSYELKVINSMLKRFHYKNLRLMMPFQKRS